MSEVTHKAYVGIDKNVGSYVFWLYCVVTAGTCAQEQSLFFQHSHTLRKCWHAGDLVR